MLAMEVGLYLPTCLIRNSLSFRLSGTGDLPEQEENEANSLVGRGNRVWRSYVEVLYAYFFYCDVRFDRTCHVSVSALKNVDIELVPDPSKTFVRKHGSGTPDPSPYTDS